MTFHHSFLSLGLCTLLVACGGLPQDVVRPVSHALETSVSTTLGASILQRHDAARSRHSSGFLLLSGPDEAFGSRLALTQAAEKTLDLQYYAIHADASTARLLRSVVAAARRGVRVRVLLDDFHSTGRDAQVMRLAFEPNIEMRMFNPVAGPRASKLGRIASAVLDFSRAQQRMHNKLFIADNAMGITGGRNLGDAYFGNAKAGNFVDLDVLAVGPIVADLSGSFDSYWNNERAYPVQSLISKEDLLKMREQFRSEDDAKADEPADSTKTERPEAAATNSPAPTNREVKAEQKQRVAEFKAMDLNAARFIWAPAVVLADKPAKIAAEGADPATPRNTDSDTVAASATADVPTENSLAAAQAPAAQTPRAAVANIQRGAPQAKPSVQSEASGDTVVDGLLQLMGQAQQDLLIVSPYFVPGKDIMKAFADARARGIRVRVLTNSLASNDAPIAHAGYMGHREALLALGVELYEMRSELAGVRSAMGLSGSSGSSRAMLHSKIMVMDSRMLVIGSMNLDLRSELQNTEIALLIRSRRLSQLATTQIETGLRELAWHVEQDEHGLVWHAPEGSDLVDMRHEPDTSLMLRLLLYLLGPLAPDHLL
ncbi:MAG: phospholipase D-like domain-containing protein [Giesbergeria sp.]